MTNEQHIAIQSVEDAHAAFNKAQESRDVARKNLDEMNASLSEWRTKFDEAKRVLDASKPALTILKAQLQKADADVAIARAELAKLAPEAVSNGKGSSQADVLKAVITVLRTAAPATLTADDIFARLPGEGVEMAGEKARSNLTAYLGRWSKVPGSDIVSKGRGQWTVRENESPVPAFLAPAPTPVVPDFLVGVDPAVKTEEAPADDALPADLPGRDALLEAGYDTVEKVKHKTVDQLRRVRGVGAETARQILAVLNPEA